MAIGRKVRVRRYKVEDRSEGEAYFVSPSSGSLFVFPMRDLESEALRRHARSLGIKFTAPRWNRGEFREDPDRLSIAGRSAADMARAADFARWSCKTARRVGALRALVPLPVLVASCRRRSPFAQTLGRNECLRAVRAFGPGQRDTCLETSLAQATYLSGHGVGCTLCIGCWPPTIDMHAWVSVGIDASACQAHDILVTEPLERVATYQPSLTLHFPG